MNILRDAAQVGGSSFMCVRNPNGIGKPRLTVWRADSVSSIGNSGSDCGSDCVPSLALLSIQSRTGCTEDRKYFGSVCVTSLGSKKVVQVWRTFDAKSNNFQNIAYNNKEAGYFIFTPCGNFINAP